MIQWAEESTASAASFRIQTWRSLPLSNPLAQILAIADQSHKLHVAWVSVPQAWFGDTVQWLHCMFRLLAYPNLVRENRSFGENIIDYSINGPSSCDREWIKGYACVFGVAANVVIMWLTVECLLNECTVISGRGLCFSQPIISRRPSGTIIWLWTKQWYRLLLRWQISALRSLCTHWCQHIIKLDEKNRPYYACIWQLNLGNCGRFSEVLQLR